MFLLYFINFLFFHQMKAFLKPWQMFFISPKKLFLFLRYSNFCDFSLPSTLSRFKRTNGSGIIWCHELACINLQMWCLEQLTNHVILHHQTWSDNIWLRKKFFWTCFVTWRATGQSSRSLLFLITLSIKRDWVQKKK